MTPDRDTPAVKPVGTRPAESGIAALWLVLVMLVLLGFAGFAIDLGFVNYTANKAQRAADSAALAGAVFLPDELSLASATAANVAAQNDYPSGVTVALGTKSNQLDVTVDVDTPAVFARLFGRNSFKVVRRAVAEWLPPLGIGSPDAKLGNDPETSGPQPNFWVSLFGPAARKHDGDRYGADNCVDDPSDNHTPVYRCTSTANARGNNGEFIPDGYRYAVNVGTPPAGQDLVVEVFDPVLANVGSRCDVPGTFPSAAQMSALSASIADASTRYREGTTAAGLQWCTGDGSGYYWPAGYSGATPTSTRFTVLTPERGTFMGSATSNIVPLGTPTPIVTTSTTTTLPAPQGGTCVVGGAASSVTVNNNRSTNVLVARLDSACNRVSMGPVSPGGFVTFSGGVGERWQVLRQGDELVLEDFALPVGGVSKTYTDPPPGSGEVIAGPCSIDSITPRTVNFINNRSSDLQLFWVDDACVRQPFGTVAAAGTVAHPTFDTHRWQVVDPATQAVVDDFVMDWTTTAHTYESPTGAGGTTSLTSTTACEVMARSYPLTSYTSANPTSGTMNQLLNPYDGVHDNASGTRDSVGEEFALGFRRWVQVCRIPAAQVIRGQYVLRVRTDAEEPTGGTGVNRMSLRAAWVDPFTGTASGAGLSMNALERFPVFVNLGGATSSDLYMTRISDIHAGRRLRIDLFDIGDTASGTVNLELLPPADGSGSAWSCSMTRVTGNDSTAVGTGCSINNLTRADFNGSVTRISVDIPPDYTCDASVPTNCWTKMRMTFNGGAAPTDQTTWTAVIEGDPLRLVR